MQRFKNLLFVADIDANDEVFDHAVDLAHQNDARLTAIIAAKPLPTDQYLSQPARQLISRERSAKATASLERLSERASGKLSLETVFVEERPFLAIIRDVLQNRRDLVIKQTGGMKKPITRLFGTTDMHLLRKCPCPVWFIKPDTDLRRDTVMACVDLDEEDATPSDCPNNGMTPLNQTILEIASSLALKTNREFHIVHAWDAIAEDLMRSRRSGLSTVEVDQYVHHAQTQHERWLERLVTAAKFQIGNNRHAVVEMHRHAERGPPRYVIPALVSELGVNVLVMGTVARVGIPGLFIGNTAEAILNAIDCSVLAVKPPGFVSPVSAARTSRF